MKLHSYRESHSTAAHSLGDDKEEPCYICEKYGKKYGEKVRNELHVNKERWKSKKKKNTAVTKRQGSGGWCTHNGRCNVCSHCLPVSWRLARCTRQTRGTRVHPLCAGYSATPTRPPAFRRRTSNVTFTDGVRLIRRCVMQMAARRNPDHRDRTLHCCIVKSGAE